MPYQFVVWFFLCSNPGGLPTPSLGVDGKIPPPGTQEFFEPEASPSGVVAQPARRTPELPSRLAPPMADCFRAMAGVALASLRPEHLAQAALRLQHLQPPPAFRQTREPPLAIVP